MRKTIIAAAIAALTTITSAQAADSIVPPAPVDGDAVATQGENAVVRGQSSSSRSYQTRTRRDGFFARWMELERRKNEWLRSRLGR